MSSTGALLVAFALLAIGSILASSRFVIALERVGARLSLSEAALGLLAALGADTPEITSSITALVHHQRAVSVSVVLGANIFNLAALLGLGAISAGRITLHRSVVVLSALPALFVALMTLGVEHHGISRWPAAGLLLGLLVPYTLVLEAPRRVLRALRVPSALSSSIERVVRQEEHDLEGAIAPDIGRPRDFLLASGMLVIVVVASVVMERVASTVGERNHWSTFVIGGVVLAAVTSLPNAVAAIYLALRGRGAATLSTAVHSNILNVLFGLVIPALFVGVGEQTRTVSSLALCYLAITMIALAFAYVGRGLGRVTGSGIVLAYVACIWYLTHL